jgi:hypothetical protein
VFAQIGSLPDEASARLHAGAQLLAHGRVPEAVAQLERANEFFRSAGATAYGRECDALLATVAASRSAI